VLSRKTYAIASLLLVLIAYIIPYTILYNARGFELLLFWFLVVVIEFLLSIAYLKSHGEK